MSGKFDFEIEFIEAGGSARPAPEIPKNAVQVGQISAGDVRVYIGQEILRQLDAMSSFDVRKETGSFLVGDFAEKDGATCAIIMGFIDARYTDASSASLTFTHRTWGYVSEQLERRFPGLRILGWQHTHPNYGVFLSEYDLFIQENFFNLPYQVAYVVDPVRSHKGFFAWKQGRVCPLSGYYVFGNLGEKIELEPGVQPAHPQKKRRKWLFWLVLGLALLAMGVAAATLLLGHSGKGAPPGAWPGIVELADHPQNST